ncbi:MAG TPA: GNAT family N-acetyltransferase [Mycobacteriales bacterium]
METVVLRHHDAEEAGPAAGRLAELYRLSHLGTPREHDPFHSVERFLERLGRYRAAPGFELVTAEADHELAGYVFGYALPRRARWWDGLLDPVPEGFTDETGHRTFGVNELHVGGAWRGRGIASRLHDELVRHRPEERATLLVDPGNPAREVYLHWGYRMVGRLQPFPDSPVYHALVLDLCDVSAPRPRPSRGAPS